MSERYSFHSIRGGSPRYIVGSNDPGAVTGYPGYKSPLLQEQEYSYEEPPVAQPFSSPRKPGKYPWGVPKEYSKGRTDKKAEKYMVSSSVGGAREAAENIQDNPWSGMGSTSSKQGPTGTMQDAEGMLRNIAGLKTETDKIVARQRQALGAISRTKFSDIPEELRPDPGFFHPHYPGMIRQALEDGSINEAQYQKLYKEWQRFDNTAAGIQMRAEREKGWAAGRQQEFQEKQTLDEIEELKFRAREELGRDEEIRMIEDMEFAARQAGIDERKRHERMIADEMDRLRNISTKGVSLGGGEIAGMIIAGLLLGGKMGGIGNMVGAAINSKMQKQQLEISKGERLVGMQQDLLKSVIERIGDEELAYGIMKKAAMEDADRFLQQRSYGLQSRTMQRNIEAARVALKDKIYINDLEIQSQLKAQSDGVKRKAAAAAGAQKLELERQKRIKEQLGEGNWMQAGSQFTPVTNQLGTMLPHSKAGLDKIRDKLGKFEEWNYHLDEMKRLAQSPNVWVPGTADHVAYTHHHSAFTGVNIHDLIGGQQAQHEYDRIAGQFPKDARPWKDIQKTGNMAHTIDLASRAQNVIQRAFMNEHGLMQYKSIPYQEKKGGIGVQPYIRLGGGPSKTEEVQFSPE